MKIEINHPENISLPPRNLSNPLNKLNTTEIIPTPPLPEKIPKFPKASPALQKNLDPSQKNLNFPEKLPFPKNSITITEIISNTRTKSQPLLLNPPPPSPQKISTPRPPEYNLNPF